MTCSNNSCNSCSSIWGSCNRCSSCGCNSGCSSSSGCYGSCGCSSCSGSSRSGSCGCSSCTAHTGCSGSCGCNNGCSSGCNGSCNGNCTYTQLRVTIPASGVCKVCCSGIAINSVNTALISGRYVTSVSYTATMDYIDRCGCRRTATTTQTTQVYLPESCMRFTNVCARVVRRNAVNNCCGAGICAVLQVCCR
ncbi:hypothetical protein H9X81_05710 [Hydrogenoanaerobacterium saccharovorans]|uniref:Uncharacterized protein n=1 Tax=Hydrogenoanaerobacterium saccharovorans TaxID=474960 RepID=A0ABS2GNK0_9FIRM|nr:hypothetical protein [Hydrogenoanaerobacterium saccharovorans]MBM6923186.1 hypothetical protein [Hydrogenoanaerobacterium saccharovorans]